MLRLLAGTTLHGAWEAAASCSALSAAVKTAAACGAAAHGPGFANTGCATTRSLHLAPPFLVEDYVPAAVTTYRLGCMKVNEGSVPLPEVCAQHSTSNTLQ